MANSFRSREWYLPDGGFVVFRSRSGNIFYADRRPYVSHSTIAPRVPILEWEGMQQYRSRGFELGADECAHIKHLSLPLAEEVRPIPTAHSVRHISLIVHRDSKDGDSGTDSRLCSFKSLTSLPPH